MALGTQFDAEELGFMSPSRVPVNELVAGEVGYVITGLRTFPPCASATR